MKRFWHTARAEAVGGLHGVALDGRPLNLPGGPRLLVAFPSLAAAVAAEWQQAGGEPGGAVRESELRLTQLAGTAVLRIAPDPAPTRAALARYGEGDVLCYRAERPNSLVVRQHHAWQPWLDWAARVLGARLVVTRGLMPVAQPAQSLAALAAALDRVDPYGLAALGVLVPAYGSLVLGLAVAWGALGAADGLTLATLDAAFQAEQWGEDAEAAARHADLAAEVDAAGRFLDLTRAEAAA